MAPDPVDGEPCDLSGRPTLERAAALAWGEDWEGWKRAQHADRVVARGVAMNL